MLTTSLIIQGMQIKIMGYHYVATRQLVKMTDYAKLL